jgi:hypothetical protein
MEADLLINEYSMITIRLKFDVTYVAQSTMLD